MAFFPIDFRHKPYSASFPFELRRVKALFCRIAILWTHHFTFEGVRLVIRSGFRRLYWKAQGKSTGLSESGWLRAVEASACWHVVVRVNFRLDFGATPRDEIHLLCLLIKDKPMKSMKLTSGYCFKCDVFSLNTLGRYWIMKHLTRWKPQPLRISLCQRSRCIYFIILSFKSEFLPNILSISAIVKVQDKGFTNSWSRKILHLISCRVFYRLDSCR